MTKHENPEEKNHTNPGKVGGEWRKQRKRKQQKTAKDKQEKGGK